MASKAQQPDAVLQWLEQCQMVIDDENFDGTELVELYEQLSDNPINLNDTNHIDQLLQLPFIVDFQCQSIKAYVEQHGQLLSVDELVVIAGFNRQLVALLRPVVTARPVEEVKPWNLKDLLSHGHSRLVVGGGGTIEQCRGYKEGIYEGSPYRLYMRYSFASGQRIQFQLSADKDAGEALFGGNAPQGFDHYGFHLQLRDMGVLKQVILGRYHLQFGQGLTLWSGFAPFNISSTDACRYARGIAPAAAFTEYGYMQGGAAVVQISPHVELSAFYSNVLRDATTDSMGVHSISNSGYHRTPSEIAKANGLREELFGIHLQYGRKHSVWGVTMTHTSFSDSLLPKQYIYNSHAWKGNRQFHLGVDGRARLGVFTFYGEVAACGTPDSVSVTDRLSAIAGVNCDIGTSRHLGLYARQYGLDYYNEHCAPQGRGNDGQAESGIFIAYHTQLPWFTAHVESDIFHFPLLRYGIYAPSQAAYARVWLERQMSRRSQLSLQYSYREGGDNVVVAGEPAYQVDQCTRRQLVADLRCDLSPWQLHSRLACSWRSGQISAMQRGFLMFQDVQYSTGRWSAVVRCLMYNVDGFDARLYAVESDMAGEFASFSYNGRGARFYIVLHCNVVSHLNLAFKYGISVVADGNTIGSGYETINEPHKQTVKLQLRYQF